MLHLWGLDTRETTEAILDELARNSRSVVLVNQVSCYLVLLVYSVTIALQAEAVLEQ